MPKPTPLRPATPIDAEIARPHPEEITEIEQRKDEAADAGKSERDTVPERVK